MFFQDSSTKQAALVCVVVTFISILVLGCICLLLTDKPFKTQPAEHQSKSNVHAVGRGKLWTYLSPQDFISSPIWHGDGTSPISSAEASKIALEYLQKKNREEFELSKPKVAHCHAEPFDASKGLYYWIVTIESLTGYDSHLEIDIVVLMDGSVLPPANGL